MASELLPKDAMDRRLLTIAAQKVGQVSGEELSQSVLGQITPAQALLRTKELLSSLDQFTIAEQQKLVLIEAAHLLESTRSGAMSSNSRSQAQHLATLKFISDRLDASIVSVDDIITRFSREHAKFFANALVGAFEIVRLELESRGIPLTEDQADEIIQSAAEKGLSYIEEVTIQSE